MYHVSTMAPLGIEMAQGKPEQEGFYHKQQIRGLPQVPTYATWLASLLVPRSLSATCYTNTDNCTAAATRVT